MRSHSLTQGDQLDALREFLLMWIHPSDQLVQTNRLMFQIPKYRQGLPYELQIQLLYLDALSHREYSPNVRVATRPSKQQLIKPFAPDIPFSNGPTIHPFPFGLISERGDDCKAQKGAFSNISEIRQTCE